MDVLGKKNKKIVYFIASIAAIAGILFGFDTGVINGALVPLAKDLQITSIFTKEFIVACVPLGALFGAIISPIFANYLGRKYSILLSATIFLPATLCVSLAQNVGFVELGRLGMGIAIGLSATIVPMYLSEVSPTNIRGSLVFLFQLAVTIGLVLAFVINHAFDENWRAMFLVGVIPSGLLAIGILLLPQSPRWLYFKNKKQRALSVIRKLNHDKDVNHVFMSLGETVEQKVIPIGKIIINPKLRKLLYLAVGLFIAQQFTGINTIFYYSETIFCKAELAIFESNVALSATIICGIVNVIATIFALRFIETFGRRTLLIYGMIGQICCLFLCGITLEASGAANDIIALTAVLGFIFFFAISLGGLPYVIMAELFPLGARDKSMAITSCANWSFNFIVSVSFLTLINLLGLGYTFWLYALLTIISLIIFIYVMPETKNMPLEKIENNVFRGKPLRNIGA